MAQAVILALGSINADIQLRAPRWPEPEETLPATDFNLLGGGKAANVAYLARRLRAPAWLLGAVGDDPLAEQALAPLRDIGVDLRGVHCSGGSTGVAVVVVPEGGKKGILLAENANGRWQEHDGARAEALIGEAPAGSILVLDLEVPVVVAERCVAAARERGLRVVLDPSPADRVSPALLEGLSAVTPNRGEAEKLLGCRIDSPQAACSAARRLNRLGVELALVKLAGGGCAVACDGDSYLVRPAEQVEVVDTTGAGDAFAGALAVALLEGHGAEDAVRWAITTAGLAVQTYGSQPAYPDRAQLEAALRNGPA